MADAGIDNAGPGQKCLVVSAVIGDQPELPVGMGLVENAADRGEDRVLGSIGWRDDGDGSVQGLFPLLNGAASGPICPLRRAMPLSLGPRQYVA